MSDMATSAVWFASIIAGMMLTLLMPVMFADSHMKEASPDERTHVASQETLHVDAENVHL